VRLEGFTASQPKHENLTSAVKKKNLKLNSFVAWFGFDAHSQHVRLHKIIGYFGQKSTNKALKGGKKGVRYALLAPSN
jgi:hypothetical protein